MMLKKELELLQLHKLSNKILCNKSFIRNSLLQESNIKLVDNYDKLSIVNSKLLKSKKLHFSVGSTIRSSFYIYKSIKNSVFQFEALNFSSKINFFFVKQFLTTLLSFQNKKLSEEKNIILREGLILYPTKRGYSCYLLGLIGFLPKHQISFLLKKTPKSSFDHYPFLSKFFLKRVNLFISKINIKFYSSNKRISKSFKSKQILKNKKFKLVFLANSVPKKKKVLKLQ